MKTANCASTLLFSIFISCVDFYLDPNDTWTTWNVFFSLLKKMKKILLLSKKSINCLLLSDDLNLYFLRVGIHTYYIKSSHFDLFLEDDFPLFLNLLLVDLTFLVLSSLIYFSDVSRTFNLILHISS